MKKNRSKRGQEEAPSLTISEDVDFEHSDDENARRHGRLRTTKLIAKFGRGCTATVENISASGVRLVSHGEFPYKKGDTIGILLELKDAEVPVKAKVVWIEPQQHSEVLVGLEFDGLFGSQKAVIADLAIRAKYGGPTLAD